MAASIGIDLGTVNFCVAVFEHDRVEIIANELGLRNTPPAVAFTDDELLIGEPAWSQVAANASNTVFGAKRIIGRRFDDVHLQKDMRHWPF